MRGQAQRQEMDALRHRVRVLAPGADASALATPAEALAMLGARASDELGFLQLFNLHRRGLQPAV